MNLVNLLQVGLAVAAAYAVVAFCVLGLRSASIGRKPTYTKAVGSETGGILYAFTRGMLPFEKESVRNHLPTFFAGMAYHAGILCSAIFVVLVAFQVDLSPTVDLIMRLFMGAGLISGVALLVKRLILPRMRVISNPDDVISNLLVDLFIATAILRTFSADFTAVFFVMTIVLLAYMPVGKIRHCIFFFYARVHFGKLFGRRGVLPHPIREE